MAKEPKVRVKFNEKTSTGVKVIHPVDAIGYGKEPVYDRLLTSTELGDALTWYNYNMDEKQSIGFLVDYLNREKDPRGAIIKAAKKLSWVFPFSLGRLAKIMLNGGILPDYAMVNFEKAMKDGLEKLAVESVVEEYVSVPRLNEKNVELLEPIETAIDDLDLTFDLRDYLAEQKVPQAKAAKVAKFYAKMLADAEKVISEDPEEYETFLEYLRAVVNEASEYAGLEDEPVVEGEKVKKPRKPRKKKVVPVEKIVAHIKTLPEFPELGITGCDPKTIVGASALWVYDTKYGKLTAFRAKEGGLSVKRTVVINFDEEASQSKRVGRKAAEITKNVLASGKVGLRNFFKDIKTAEIKYTGRLNSNMILLRVEK